MEIQMNLKRAFLTTVALLILPGFALAQTTVRFDTSLELVPAGPYTQTVTVELTCNTGNPLVQDFEIGPTTADKVVFVVDNFNLEEFISCEITATSIDGFVVVDVLGNIVEPDEGTCLWTAAAQNLLVETDNTCRFVMAPAPFEYEITKDFDFEDDVDVSRVFSINYSCTNVLTGTNDSTLGSYNSGFGDVGDSTYTIDWLIANPWADAAGEYTTCTATETVYDSAVESDQGCQAPTTFMTGDGLKGCTITNSVFFEGIPTLSQYGLAVMALLMLGLGFVGFRRFV
jgi:hypothetical protein